jgi:hypothetical protein
MERVKKMTLWMKKMTSILLKAGANVNAKGREIGLVNGYKNYLVR